MNDPTPANTCEMILQSHFPPSQRKITMDDALAILRWVIKNHTVHSMLYVPPVFKFATWYIQNHYLRQCLREDQTIHFSSEIVQSPLKVVYGDTDFDILINVTRLNLEREIPTKYASWIVEQLQKERSNALKLTSLLMFKMFH